MARVRATTKGYWGGVIRETGDVFDIPEGVTLPWAAEVDGSVPRTESPMSTSRKRDAKARTRAKPSEPVVMDATPFADSPQPATVHEAVAATVGVPPDWVQQ